VLVRAVVAPPLPATLRPTWFILLVPPTLIYANGIALFRDFVFLENLYPFALVLAAALLAYARESARWPFGVIWWGMTFPLDALAYAAARYAGSHPEPLWRWLCAATLLLAAAVVLLVLARSMRALAARRKA
jgi:tellurite resistance protein